MTENHNYETPDAGTTDWHEPLNSNFEQIDTDMEIRDSESNLDNYTPTEFSKFLATDTGNVYIGNGSEWYQLGSVADSGDGGNTGSSGGGTEGISGADIVAMPGEVQNTIDQYARPGQSWGNGRRYKIKLHPTEEYSDNTMSFPVTVKRGVTLDFNGNEFYRTQDSDTVDLRPEGWLDGPQIRTTNGYSSNGILLHARNADGMNATNAPRIKGLRYKGPKGGNDTAVKLLSTVPGGMSQFTVTGRVWHAATCFDLEARDGWVNGIDFHLRSKGAQTFVRTHSNGGAIGGNYFYVDVQPVEGTSQWLWDMHHDSGPHRFNHMRGHFWDNRMYPGGTMWRLDSGVGIRNTMCDLHATNAPSENRVVNNGASANNVLWNYADGTAWRS